MNNAVLFDDDCDEKRAKKNTGAASSTKNTNMRVFIVRHAQSENNALLSPNLDNPSRQSDPSLTKKGWTQCANLTKCFTTEANGRYKRVNEMWTSPMKRCLLTAKAVEDGLRTGNARVNGEIFEHGGCFEGGRGGGGGKGGDAKTSANENKTTAAATGRPGMGRDEMKQVFPDVIVPEALKNGWWDTKRGVETVPEAQARAERVAESLWKRARGSGGLKEKVEEAEKEEEAQQAKKRKVDDEPEVGDLVIVSHGMFTDILLKILVGVPKSTGRQMGLFCSQNAGIHAIDLDVATEENICGLVQFNDVRHIPEEARTGGSVFGLDECYVSEGSA